MNSTNFEMFGTAGEIDAGKPYSANYKAGSGLIYTLKLNVPPAPTLSNPATNYDRLKFIINQGGNASDATYAISISTDNFVSDIKYIKSDKTIGNTLTTSDYKTYANWAPGDFVTGLRSGTTYYVRARARIGNFTETEWGPASTGITTSNSSLTFSLNSSSVTFDNLSPSNSYTDSAKYTQMTTSTNAYNGYTVYGRENQALKTADNFTISDYSGTNNTPTTWSGTGFGYTTDDTNLGGTGGINRFSGGTKYAGFITTGPGDIVADHSGPVQDPTISNEHFNIHYRVTVDATTPAGTYSNIILYTIVPTF
jgi:heat shock protein HslJ